MRTGKKANLKNTFQILKKKQIFMKKWKSGYKRNVSSDELRKLAILRFAIDQVGMFAEERLYWIKIISN